MVVSERRMLLLLLIVKVIWSIVEIFPPHEGFKSRTLLLLLLVLLLLMMLLKSRGRFIIVPRIDPLLLVLLLLLLLRLPRLLFIPPVNGLQRLTFDFFVQRLKDLFAFQHRLLSYVTLVVFLQHLPEADHFAQLRVRPRVSAGLLQLGNGLVQKGQILPQFGQL